MNAAGVIEDITLDSYWWQLPYLEFTAPTVKPTEKPSEHS